MKFGGTCVEGPENRALTADRIVEAKDRGLSPVVVVSAMGREGQPYSTANLVKFVRETNPNIAPRELDLLMSMGEIISTVMMAHLLRAQGFNTIALTGGQAGLLTDTFYGHAEIVDIQPDYLLRSLNEGYVIFVAGFQGVTGGHEAHDITTLGEGGSDYTAVALAFTLQQPRTGVLKERVDVEPIHIYKDVDGVMTANPKSMRDDDGRMAGKGPKLLSTLTYDELVMMAHLGADVMQHKASVMARRHRLPILIRNYSTNAPGTEISTTTIGHSYREVTAVTDIGDLLIFTLPASNPRLGSQLSEDLTRQRLTHWEITTEPNQVRLAVRREKYRNIQLLIDHILFDRGLAAETSASRWGLVSLIGEGMRGRVSEFKKKADAILKGEHIDTFGAIEGELNLSYLVREEDRRQAVKSLHSSLVE
jgi:aspartate kinase